MVEDSLLPQDAKHTAEFIQLFNDLFDTFNSSSVYHSKTYKRAIGLSSNHDDLLTKATDYISSLTPRGTKKVLPSLKGWINNIKSIRDLVQLMSNFDADYLMTRRINQDMLENFFSQVRLKGGHIDNPDTRQFASAY